MTGEDRGPGGEKTDRKKVDSSVSGIQFAGAGFQFTAMVILSAFAGIWLDRKVGTSPWLLIVTVFVGAAIGFFTLYRNLMKGQRLGDQRRHEERRDVGE